MPTWEQTRNPLGGLGTGLRHKPYLQAGRFETEDEARVIDQRVRQLLDVYGMPYADVPGNADGVEEVSKRTVAAIMRRNTGNRPT